MYELSEILKRGPEFIRTTSDSLFTTNILFLTIAGIILALFLGIIVAIKIKKRQARKNSTQEPDEIHQLKTTCDELQQKLKDLTAQIKESEKEKRKHLGEKGELIVTPPHILPIQEKDLAKEVERYKNVLNHVSSLQEKVVVIEEIEGQEIALQGKPRASQKVSGEKEHLPEKEAQKIIDSSAALGKFSNEF